MLSRGNTIEVSPIDSVIKPCITTFLGGSLPVFLNMAHNLIYFYSYPVLWSITHLMLFKTDIAPAETISTL